MKNILKPFQNMFNFENFLRVNATMIFFALIPLIIAIVRTIRFSSPIWMRCVSVLVEIFAVALFILLNQKRQVKYVPSQHPYIENGVIIITYIVGVILLIVLL